MPEPVAALRGAQIRSAIYAGRILSVPANPASEDLARDVVEILRAEFGGDLQTAHERLSESEFFSKTGAAREAMAGDPRLRARTRDVLAGLGLEPGDHAVDLLRLRAVPPGGAANPLAARAYFLHRDTWYGNPQAQINVWMPLFDVTAENTFALYPGRFLRPVDNDSAGFDYDTFMRTTGWSNPDASRNAVYPTTAEDPGDAVRPALKRGELLLFSAAHLHRTAPVLSGEARFSIDFRVVHREDHAAGRGAANVDNRSTGCAFVDYV